MPSEKTKDLILPLVFLLVLGGLIAGVYYWLQHEREAEERPFAEAPPEPEAETEPKIRHPVQRRASQEAEPLEHARSDEGMQQAAGDMIGLQSLERFFNLDSIARRFVLTVDNLPRGQVPQRHVLAKQVEGRFLATGNDGSFTLDPANYRRYAPYIKLAEAIDTKKLLAVYVHFYPLFQAEYRNLGYPDRYFNDRLIDTIDDVLAAPEVKGPIKLVQPKVRYEYADPELESLSAGQKIMIRMGPENAARVKAKLREIRRELTSGG